MPERHIVPSAGVILVGDRSLLRMDPDEVSQEILPMWPSSASEKDLSRSMLYSWGMSCMQFAYKMKNRPVRYLHKAYSVVALELEYLSLRHLDERERERATRGPYSKSARPGILGLTYWASLQAI